MELCQDVITGLSLLRDDSRVNKSQLIELISTIGQSLTCGIGSSLDKAMDSAELKLVGLAIVSVFLETAKNNKALNEEMLLIETSLNEAAVDSHFTQLIVDEYKVIEKQLKGHLANIKISTDMKESTLSELIDTRWRQDVIIKSKYRNQVNEINYLVDLLNNHGRRISFSSDLPGLQDLGYQLKDCCKAVENTFKIVN